MLQGPQRVAPERRKRKKNKNDITRSRAQTYNYNPTNTANNGFSDNQNNSNNKPQPQPQQQQQAQTDDLLDLFGYNDNNNNSNNNNNANNNNNNNAFDDPFFNFVNNNDTDTNTNTNANGNNNNNDNGDESKIKNGKKKSKKKNKKKEKQRAQTVASTNETKNVNYKNFASKKKNNNNNVQKPAKKMKKIDVLPLLHKGVRCNKFKLNGNKSKVRTFYLSDNNFYFCWEAVGVQKKEKGGLFSKKSDKSNRSKIDKDRSIPIRSIRSLQKNPAYMMQSYNFIPAQQKALTITIVYSANGQDKKLNFMAYEAFHCQLLQQGLEQLIAAARDPKRNLSEVFELYVDFEKEILPKHLRPQRFKWEPLGDNDYLSQNENDNNDNDNNNDKNSYFDDNTINNIDVYDPTSHGQFGRSRIKSF